MNSMKVEFFQVLWPEIEHKNNLLVHDKKGSPSTNTQSFWDPFWAMGFSLRLERKGLPPLLILQNHATGFGTCRSGLTPWWGSIVSHSVIGKGDSKKKIWGIYKERDSSSSSWTARETRRHQASLCIHWLFPQNHHKSVNNFNFYKEFPFIAKMW